MRLSAEEWKHSVLESKTRLAIPVMTNTGIVLLGTSVRNAIDDPRIHSAAVNAVAEQFPTAAATLMMDLSVEAEAFGATIRYLNDEVPAVSGQCVADTEAIGRLEIPPVQAARIPRRLAALKQTVNNIQDRPVLAECIGPFSLAARLFGVVDIMTALHDQPEAIHALLEKCASLLLRCCTEFKEADATGVIMAEPVAGMLSPELCDKFSSAYVRQIVGQLQDDGFLIVLHNCGETDTLVSSMANTGAAALHFGNRCDILKALAQIPGDTLVGGNLDPVGVLKAGSPEEVAQATLRLLEQTAVYPNFVLSSGCDVAPNTPVENIRALFAALKQFNNSKR
jgi:uroporphyrinogen decarboxylase